MVRFGNIFVFENYLKDKVVIKVLTSCYCSFTYSITPLPDNAFRNISAANAPNNIERNQPFSSFVSFLIVSLISFITKPGSTSDLTIFFISFISSFEIVNAVVSDP